jgi:acyl-CoA thioesterase
MRIKVGSEVTLSGTINFYAPGRLGDALTAVCTPRRVGKTICAVFCEVRNQDGKLIADSLQNFYRIYGE